MRTIKRRNNKPLVHYACSAETKQQQKNPKRPIPPHVASVVTARMKRLVIQITTQRFFRFNGWPFEKTIYNKVENEQNKLDEVSLPSPADGKR